MLDYTVSSAETIYPVKLKVSKEEAVNAVKQILDANADDLCDTDRAEEALYIHYLKKNMAQVSSAISGPTRLNAMEDFVKPFLVRCVDPDAAWFIKEGEVLGTEIKEWLIRFESGKETSHIEADSAFAWLCQQLNAGNILANENKIEKKGEIK